MLKRLLVALLFLVSLDALVTPVRADDGQEALTALRRLVGLIRYERNEQALNLIATDRMVSFLLGSNGATPEQESRIAGLLGEYIELKAFPMALEYFKDIDLTYDAPTIVGDQVHIRSSVLYGGSEQVTMTWVMARVGPEYKLVDFLDQQGQSQMTINRDRVITPLINQRGVDGLISQMQTTINGLRQQ